MSDVPKWNPEHHDRSVFRETFLQMLGDDEAKAAFRAFAGHFLSRALEGRPYWHGTPADSLAEELEAVATDLRHLIEHLEVVGFIDPMASADEPISQREERWCRFALGLRARLGLVVIEIEEELLAGLDVPDEPAL